MPVDLVPVQGEILSRLTRLGVDVARVLAHAAIARSRFDERGTNKAHLSTREFFAFWNAVEEVGGVRNVGLRLGSEALPHEYNIAFMAAVHAATFGDALQKLGRYKRLTCPEDLRVTIARGEARLEFQWLLAEGDAPTALVEGAFAGVLALASRGVGKKIVPRCVELARKSGKHDPAIPRHFGCQIVFDKKADRLVFEESALALPFITHNAELLLLILPGLEEQLKKGGKRSLPDDVRMVLGRSISGERPHIDKVAKELGMSARTLQRRLEEVGTSYQDLLDDIRRKTARRLLTTTELDAGEVAFLLGFEELNSFTRAFQQWEGVTPLRYRTRLRERGVKTSA